MRRIFNIIALTLTLIATCTSVSCNKVDPDFIITDGNSNNIPGSRTGSEESRHVLVLYLAGYNSLSKYMKQDYSDLLESYLPKNISRADNVLLVYTQQTKENSNYSTPLSSHLIRLYQDLGGNAVTDTLKTYGQEYISADSDCMYTVLSDVKKLFPAKSYGMVLSSHATGWLPAGYTVNNIHTISRSPIQRSIGQTQTGEYGNYTAYEMDLKRFATKIPMQMEYILFDACLMGCVEVAYELKDVCHYVGFSPTEVVADGFDYSTLTTHLLKGTPDPYSVCYDFFAQYDPKVSSTPYCTISLVDCTKIDALASTCATFFAEHRDEMAAIEADTVQGYFRYGWHWFYDLKDIVKHAEASQSELDSLQKALDECVIYKDATPTFISFSIKNYCGLSMYLPCDGTVTLNMHYADLKWNQATNLLEIK